MHEVSEIPEEHKLLLRALQQAARVVLEVGGDQQYGLTMFRLQMQKEALARNNNNRQHAAKQLGVHRNTLTRNLPPEDRKSAERFAKRPPMRGVRIYKYPLLASGNSNAKGGLAL